MLSFLTHCDSINLECDPLEDEQNKNGCYSSRLRLQFSDLAQEGNLKHLAEWEWNSELSHFIL